MMLTISDLGYRKECIGLRLVTSNMSRLVANRLIEMIIVSRYKNNAIVCERNESNPLYPNVILFWFGHDM